MKQVNLWWLLSSNCSSQVEERWWSTCVQPYSHSNTCGVCFCGKLLWMRSTCPRVFIYSCQRLETVNSTTRGKRVSWWMKFVYVCRSMCLIWQNYSTGRVRDAMVWQRYSICWGRSLVEATVCKKLIAPVVNSDVLLDGAGFRSNRDNIWRWALPTGLSWHHKLHPDTMSLVEQLLISVRCYL